MKIINTRSIEKISSVLLMIAVLFFFTSSPTAQETDNALTIASDGSKKFESQLDELLTTLYCPCGCVRETNKACVCGVAQRIEAEFRDSLLSGDTVDEIRNEYLEKYGSQFSAVMKAEGVNWLAYLMPVVILMGIGGVIFLVRHQSREYKTVSTQPDKQVSDELQQYVESELEKYKTQN